LSEAEINVYFPLKGIPAAGFESSLLQVKHFDDTPPPRAAMSILQSLI